LRWSDVDLERRVIRWRAENDKIGYGHATPLTEEAVAVLTTYQRATQAIGDAWIFTHGRSGKGRSRRTAPRTSGSDWRQRRDSLRASDTASCRRKFATELKQTNLKDLCELGGWKAPATLLTCYVAPDEGTQREALKQRRELRSG
jgi:integrase